MNDRKPRRPKIGYSCELPIRWRRRACPSSCYDEKLLFSVVEVTSHEVVFEMTLEVLNFITQHVHNLAEGIASVE